MSGNIEMKEMYQYEVHGSGMAEGRVNPQVRVARPQVVHLDDPDLRSSLEAYSCAGERGHFVTIL